MFDYEKLGVFYLGRETEASGSSGSGDAVLYDSRDLTTHAMIVGMTGSGKTGLGITLLEEAAIDGIPSLIIDPKGDMGNLMLTFPNLSTQEFLPWIDPEEARRKGTTPEELASKQAEQWKNGLADWDQPVDRVTRLRSAAEVAIYTPGSSSGIPLTVMRSLDAPSETVRQNGEALRDRAVNAVSGLLTLLGINADPLKSREHIFLTTLLQQTWQEGKSLDIPQLIRQIQSPSFQNIGVMDLETIFPAADRMGLAVSLNNMLASPAFASWTQGEALDVQRLLFTPEGKPKMSVVSIAHLSDQNRMFFVTMLLNEILAWTRTQAGTSSLRAIIYMDEVFGYLPPTSNPPSKTPLLTLLKQARAYGVGMVLATQNPVDLDYKALSNIGTWFLGRLNTERDKLRVLDGLEGVASDSNQRFDRRETDRLISSLGKRCFLMNNVHEDQHVVFQTRWALSYLRGPLTPAQIQTLMADRKKSSENSAASSASDHSSDSSLSQNGSSLNSAAAHPPVIESGIAQQIIAVRRDIPRDAVIHYRPSILGVGQVHYVDSKSKTDHWQKVAFLAPTSQGMLPDFWEDGNEISLNRLRDEPAAETAQFEDLPSECQRAASYKRWGTSFKNYLYQHRTLLLQLCSALKAYSLPDETEGDFKARLSHIAREFRDEEVAKLKKKYESKITTAVDRVRRAEQTVTKEKQEANSATMTAAMSFGQSILGALLGRKKVSTANVTRASTSMRSAGRVLNRRGDVKTAEENLQIQIQRLNDLEKEIEDQTHEIQARFSSDGLILESYEVRSRKSDISADQVQLVWLPYTSNTNGRMEAAYETQLYLEKETVPTGR